MEEENQEQISEIEVAEAQLRKLKLEILALERQHSWKGQLSHFATAITILVAALGLWLSFERYRSDADKDRILREKELAERIDNQYRSDITQLVRFPNDESLQIPMAELILNDLHELIETRPQQDEAARDKKVTDIANTLRQILESSDSDFRKLRNVELDVSAVYGWDGYAHMLRQSPQNNMMVLIKYCEAFEHLHEEIPIVIDSITADGDSRFQINEAVNFKDYYYWSLYRTAKRN